MKSDNVPREVRFSRQYLGDQDPMVRSMSSSYGQITWFHCNRYCAKAACEHCGGVVRHETWCISANPVVYYAHQIVLDSSKLTLADALALLALGAVWEDTNCQGDCRNS